MPVPDPLPSMINIRVQRSGSQSSCPSSGDAAVHRKKRGPQSDSGLFRHIVLNKSVSMDGMRCSTTPDRRMVSSTNDVKFAFIREDMSDSSPSSSPDDEPHDPDLEFGRALSTTTDDAVSITSSRRSRQSHRQKVLIRRQKLKNIKILHSPMDLISSSSSDDEDDADVTADDQSNHNMRPETSMTLKREAKRLADEMLLTALCYLSSDESSSSISSDLCHCDPPSVMDRLTISSTSSVESAKQKVCPRVRRFRSATPHRIRRQAMRNIIHSESQQELSLLLEMTKPPSLMEQISGKSDHGAGACNSASSNSLNSLNSEIFDLPASDPQVNEAANLLTEGMNELTKNAEQESEHKTFPIDDRVSITTTRSQDSLSVAATAGSCSSTFDSSTTTYSIDASPVVSPLVKDSDDDDGNCSDKDISGEARDELLGDVSPVPLMDYMRIVMSESGDVDSQSDFGVDDLPTDNTMTLIAGDKTPDDNKTLVEDASSGNSYQTCPPASGEEVSSCGSCYTDAVDDAFNDSSGSEFQSAEDYERFLIHENVKFLAHTLAEMAYCTNSSATTDDFKSLVSGSSFDLIDMNDVSVGVSDDDEDSRATYNVSSDSKIRKEEARQLEMTYRLESPRITTSRSTGFVSLHKASTDSSDTTYSLEPPVKEKSTVRVRETRSSALRTERARKARSMEVNFSDIRPSAVTTSRQTFAKAVRRPLLTPTSCASEARVVSSAGIQSSLQSKGATTHSETRTPAPGQKQRTGVQGKFSAFLQRIRS